MPKRGRACHILWKEKFFIFFSGYVRLFHVKHFFGPHFSPARNILQAKIGETLVISRFQKIVQKFSGYVRLFHVKHFSISKNIPRRRGLSVDGGEALAI